MTAVYRVWPRDESSYTMPYCKADRKLLTTEQLVDLLEQGYTFNKLKYVGDIDYAGEIDYGNLEDDHED